MEHHQRLCSGNLRQVRQPFSVVEIGGSDDGKIGTGVDHGDMNTIAMDMGEYQTRGI